MTDMRFEESCPCGGKFSVSGYTSEVRTHVENWRKVHNQHARAIARAMAENVKWPIYYVPSQPVPGAQPYPWQNPITFTETNSAGTQTPK